MSTLLPTVIDAAASAVAVMFGTSEVPMSTVALGDVHAVTSPVVTDGAILVALCVARRTAAATDRIG